MRAVAAAVSAVGTAALKMGRVSSPLLARWRARFPSDAFCFSLITAPIQACSNGTQRTNRQIDGLGQAHILERFVLAFCLLAAAAPAAAAAATESGCACEHLRFCAAFGGRSVCAVDRSTAAAALRREAEGESERARQVLLHGSAL